MRSILIIVLINAIVQNILSQAFTISDLNTLYDHYTFEKSRSNSIDPARYNTIEGTPYLVEKFIKGEVIINDSILIKNVPLRYNAYTDKIEFTDDQNRILEVNTAGKNFTFKFDNRHFNFLEYINRNDKFHGVLELLVDGKIRLYRKSSVKFEEATKEIGYQNAKPNRFVRLDDIYLIAFRDDIPQAVYTKKDMLLKLEQIIPDIELYIKNSGLKMKSEKSLIDFIKYCNSKL